MRHSKGFTLVEVIVAVCVLAILAGVGVVAYVRYIDKAQEKTCYVNRTELARDYEDFRDLFDSQEPMADYVSAQANGLANICPAGGACSCGDKDGRPYIYCSRHEAGGGGTEPSGGDEPGGGETGGGDTPADRGSWQPNTSYVVGDRILEDGIEFVCVSAHTSTDKNNDSKTRNPADEKGNTSSWQVVGYAGGVPRVYSSHYAYAEGATVVYKGVVYVRTGYNPSGRQSPKKDRDSDYWTIVD